MEYSLLASVPVTSLKQLFAAQARGFKALLREQKDRTIVSSFIVCICAEVECVNMLQKRIL